MSHISGHWEQEPAVGAASNPYSLGILTLTSFPEFRILFFNNQGTNGLNVGDEIGFHLQLIPIQNLQCDGAQFFGIAYDVIPITVHKDLDSKAAKFKKKVEDLDTIAQEAIQNWFENELNPNEQIAYNQTVAYKKTKSYDILYNKAAKYDYNRINEPKYDDLVDSKRRQWISDHVKNYSNTKLLTDTEITRMI